MNYKLAKELKDAGFPQKGRGWHIDPLGHLTNQVGEPRIPTLSELIEACGEDFGELRRTAPKRGSVKMRWFAGNLLDICGLGKTPEEAVARLWLALKKKP